MYIVHVTVFSTRFLIENKLNFKKLGSINYKSGRGNNNG